MKKLSFNPPMLSSLLENRTVCLSLAGSLSLHFSLVFSGLPSWQCPIRYGLGIPCPGCGLSRGIVALCQGNWQQALKIHAFAPLMMAGVLLIIGAAILPKVYQLWGIFGIICGLYTFIWGWINAERFAMQKTMLIWTICIIAGIAANVIISAASS